MKIRELPKSDPSIAAFRHRAALPHRLSQRADKPHIWFFEGYWRVSLWPHTSGSLEAWRLANAAAAEANNQIKVERYLFRTTKI